MTCGQCGHENPAAQKFCGDCGARLTVACPACQAANPPANKFCGECGARLVADARAPDERSITTAAPRSVAPAAAPVTSGADRFASPDSYTPKHLAEKILTSRSAIEGERKQVTVMFTDVSGFTAMSERLDPEDVHAIMNRAFEVILDAVHAREGTINQFLGDGVMALFGAPIAHEDHAQRALSAALAIQRALEPLRDEVRAIHGVDFRMRVGINTGPVVVGAIGKDLRMDYTAVGDTTNLAARLLALAQPGQIVVSRRTQHRRDRWFVFEDLGEFQVKGKSEPVAAYALTGEARSRTWLESSSERRLTPLVGRAQELSLLDAAWEQARTGKGASVCVEGEPGVGKSRLIYEFMRGLDGTGAVLLEAACPSYGRSIPFRPLMEMLREYLRLSENSTADAVRAGIAEGLDGVDLPSDERTVLLAHFLGVSAPAEFLNRLSGAELKERTFGALEELFLRASRVAPMVLLIENVHWADQSSADFIARLAQRLPGHRILLLLSTRPGYVPWLNFPGLEKIVLDSLPGTDVERMVPALLGVGAVSGELLTLLADKGEGNPLYVEEIVHELQETGGIVLENDEARLRSSNIRVPATIHDIIAARVDRLDEPLKLNLQGAAVVGRRFGVSLLSRVVQLGPDDVSRDLRELHGLDFVFPASADPELMYSFKHALTQDVVYNGLLERRRRLYHAAAGRGLEQLYRNRLDEVVELLAYHFAASAEDEKAVDYALLAAEKAQRRWANSEALVQFESALSRLETMPDTPANRVRRIDAVVKQAEVRFALGRHAEHVEALDKIRDVVEASADPARRASWYYWAGFLRSLIGGRPDIPIAYCREAQAIADASGIEDIRAFAECCLAHVLMVAGDLRGAIEAGERALATFEARGNIWWACRALWALSPVANAIGEWERGLDYCRRALEHGQAVDDLRLKVVGWWRTGSTHIQRGDAAPGLRCCAEALSLAPIPFDAAMITAVRGYGLLKSGDLTAGAADLADAVSWFDRSRLPYTRSLFALWLGEAQLALGQRPAARDTLLAVLATARENGYRHLEGVAERLVAEALEPEDPEADEHLRAALRILEEIDARNDFAKAVVAQAGRLLWTGDVDGATTRLERALAIFRDLGTPGLPIATALLTVSQIWAAERVPLCVVVQSSRHYVHAVLRRFLSGCRDIDVVLDRRRETAARYEADERRSDDDARDRELRERGYVVVPVSRSERAGEVATPGE
jgi:class 3 adenylate cyclase/tetratricopeptide (TPR) repeat protein